VAGKILEELQQKRAFTGPEAEAFLNVVRTASGELVEPPAETGLRLIGLPGRHRPV
jgi:hypothetical protein